MDQQIAQFSPGFLVIIPILHFPGIVLYYYQKARDMENEK
jgi:hypothetical protein